MVDIQQGAALMLATVLTGVAVAFARLPGLRTPIRAVVRFIASQEDRGCLGMLAPVGVPAGGTAKALRRAAFLRDRVERLALNANLGDGRLLAPRRASRVCCADTGACFGRTGAPTIYRRPIGVVARLRAVELAVRVARGRVDWLTAGAACSHLAAGLFCACAIATGTRPRTAGIRMPGQASRRTIERCTAERAGAVWAVTGITRGDPVTAFAFAPALAEFAQRLCCLADTTYFSDSISWYIHRIYNPLWRSMCQVCSYYTVAHRCSVRSEVCYG